MLINEYLPEYDFVEKHRTKVRAKGSVVFRAVNEANFGESWIIRTLFFLRGLPTGNITLSKMRDGIFETLGEKPNDELLLGLVGQPWKPSGGLKKVDAASFKGFKETGFAKMAWNFVVRRSGWTNSGIDRNTDKVSRPRKPSKVWILLDVYSTL